MVHLAFSKTAQPVGISTSGTAAARMWAGLAGWLALAMPVFAFADDLPLVVDVNVAVAPSCSITNATPSINLGELSKPGSATLTIGFSCNSHFQFILSSRYGGLKHHTWTSVLPPFVSLVPYVVSYTLGTSDGVLVGACSSGNMVQGASACSGASSPDATAINQSVTISFSWALSGQYPVVGSYYDRLNFNVSAGL